MGELVAAQPALRLSVAVSLPIDFISTLALLYRAVPGAGLDPWLVSARRALPDETRYDLDILEGFSGRLLYYLEGPVNRFQPLAPENLDATFPDLLDFLTGFSAEDYRAMAIEAVQRVRRDAGFDETSPSDHAGSPHAEIAWRRFLEPALTTATADDILPLLERPEELRNRTISLFRTVWQTVYREDYLEQLDVLQRAAERASVMLDRGFGQAFSELTGARLPATLMSGLQHINVMVFHPSAHIGSYISYLLDPPRGIIFFSAPGLLGRTAAPPVRATPPASAASVIEPPPSGTDRPVDERAREEIATRSAANVTPSFTGPMPEPTLDVDQVVENARALGDSTRLRILEMLADGEHYAQEIVSSLGIAQSAVSRHLALLERSGLVSVRPHRGMKYYIVNPDGVRAFVAAIAGRLIPGTAREE